jgi:threonine dehydratase
MPLAISFDDVRGAAERLRPIAHRTPVVTSRTLDAQVGDGARVFLKCENFQRGGSFKFRGAYNRLSQLSPADQTCGVVAFSSGNHAQGVALAARELSLPATIVMPTDAPATKVAATRDYGATIAWFDRATEDRELVARRIADERDATLVPSYDDPRIMAGQGTAALELLEEVGSLDLLVTPLGGGGLLSGSATAARALSPTTRLVGVETEASNDWEQSLEAGRRIRIPPPATIADGMRTQQPGELTFPVIQQLGVRVVTVSDEQVEAAVRFLLMRLKLLVEPTGAVPIAALMNGRLGNLSGQRIGVIVSGGNVDPEILCEILGRTTG